MDHLQPSGPAGEPQIPISDVKLCRLDLNHPVVLHSVFGAGPAAGCARPATLLATPANPPAAPWGILNAVPVRSQCGDRSTR